METKFGLYQWKCWLCGGKLNVQKRYTISGYSKYLIQCCNSGCGKRMVETHCQSFRESMHSKSDKLGKHMENYYAGIENTCWNVSCPKCRDIASKFK